MSAAEKIKDQAQVYASAWSLVGGRFDRGGMLEQAEEAKAELFAAIDELQAARDRIYNETLEIRGLLLQEKMEHAKVRAAHDAQEAAIQLAEQHFPDKPLIDVVRFAVGMAALDDAAARARLERRR